MKKVAFLSVISSIIISVINADSLCLPGSDCVENQSYSSYSSSEYGLPPCDCSSSSNYYYSSSSIAQTCK